MHRISSNNVRRGDNCTMIQDLESKCIDCLQSSTYPQTTKDDSVNFKLNLH